MLFRAFQSFFLILVFFFLGLLYEIGVLTDTN